MKIHGIGGYRPAGSPVSSARIYRYHNNKSSYYTNTETGLAIIIGCMLALPITIPIISFIFMFLLFGH